MTFIVAFPAIGLGMVNAYLAHQEHAAHDERPDFVPYEYMRVRTKVYLFIETEYLGCDSVRLSYIDKHFLFNTPAKSKATVAKHSVLES